MTNNFLKGKSAKMHYFTLNTIYFGTGPNKEWFLTDYQQVFHWLLLCHPCYSWLKIREKVHSKGPWPSVMEMHFAVPSWSHKRSMRSVAWGCSLWGYIPTESRGVCVVVL